METFSTDEPQHALDDANDGHATKRLIDAIARKQDVSQTELAKWYGLSRKTVYNWLQRFEEEPVCGAARYKVRVAHRNSIVRNNQKTYSYCASHLQMLAMTLNNGVFHL
ncbi:helix-turn-helix domain-containing protein [Haladaptatus halobius]|uniref:helix-turn-helix domain-containing protein n=1 Tax=Haladaptatus halobius TaxID=2884875 RepID=UPI001D09B532